MKHLTKLLTLLLASITLTGCVETSISLSSKSDNDVSSSDGTSTSNDGGSNTNIDSTVHVTSVSITNKISSLYVGDTYTFNTTVLPNNASDKSVSYSSSNDKIATISDAGVINALAAGSVTFTVKSTDGNKTDTCSLTVLKKDTTVNVTGVTLDKTSETLYVGDTLTLNATISPSNATNKSVIWSSSYASVASVNDGVVSAKGVGNTTITVITKDGNKTATCSVTVLSINGDVIQITSNNTSLKEDSSVTNPSFNYDGISSSSVSISTSGSIYTSKTTAYRLASSSSGGSITFTFSESITLNGVTLVASGYNSKESKVTIKTDGDTSNSTNVSGTTKKEYVYSEFSNKSIETKSLTVSSSKSKQFYFYGLKLICKETEPIYPTSISLPSTLELGIDETSTLSVNFTPSNTNQKSVEWSSDKPSIATVNDGLVTARALGTANISATAKDKDGNQLTANCIVTVKNIAVTGVTLNKSSITISLNNSETLTATVLPSNASNKNVTWTSNDPLIATVNNGVVSAKGLGNTTITVTTEDGNKTTSCSVEVIEAYVPSKTKLSYTYDDYTYNSGVDSCPNVGDPKLLIIPVWFSDSSTFISNKDNVRNDIETAYLGTNTETGWRSVKTYYQELSNNTVNLTGTVTDWYETNTSYKTYGTDDNSTSGTTSLVNAATNWYFTNNPSDSRLKYDTNNDGYLDGVILIYAAPDSSALNNDNYDNLWAYCFWTNNNSSTSKPTPCTFFWASYDFMYGDNASSRTGKSSYGSGNTSHCLIDTHTFIHEMGHVFGLDDYYDYSYQYNPAGGFSMQDYNVGSHDPYSVLALGWANPYIPTESCELTINTFQESKDLILLTPSWNSDNSPFDEYLLLELYSPTGLNEFDSTYKYYNSIQVPSTVGIRLWHVDARLAYFSSTSKSPSGLTTNPNKEAWVYHGMSNTYEGKDGQAYLSYMGESYYNYNLLQLIRNDTTETFRPKSLLSSLSLFRAGDTFTMSKYQTQFVNGTKLNSSKDLGWSFTVKSISNNQATISLAKA